MLLRLFLNVMITRSIVEMHMIVPPTPTLRSLMMHYGDVYLQLSKSRLTTLVVLTALGGYAMAPAATTLATIGNVFSL